MDTEALLDIYRKERMSPYLQDLGEEFYSEMDSVIKELESRYEERSKKGDMPGQGRALKELDNVTSVIRDLYDIRERKVVLSALNHVRRDGGKMDVENLTDEEEKMLGDVLDILRNTRQEILGAGPVTKTKAAKKSPAREKEEPKAESTLITVRIKKDLPSIVGVDGKVYGSFKGEDVVSLPDANAAALIKQGAAEEIKL